MLPGGFWCAAPMRIMDLRVDSNAFSHLVSEGWVSEMHQNKPILEVPEEPCPRAFVRFNLRELGDRR